MAKRKTMLIEYSSNNSGGRWWLKDADWHALVEAGWKVLWKKDAKPIVMGGKELRLGMADKDGRWLGALATKAQKRFPSVRDAILEWEKITGQNAADEGCNCCGAPHTFYWGRAVSTFKGSDKTEYGYASGEQLVSLLYGEGVPTSYREAVSMLATKGKLKPVRRKSK